jgi:G:T/U-mismatch repair DNA glycosylase
MGFAVIAMQTAATQSKEIKEKERETIVLKKTVSSCSTVKLMKNENKGRTIKRDPDAEDLHLLTSFTKSFTSIRCYF